MIEERRKFDDDSDSVEQMHEHVDVIDGVSEHVDVIDENIDMIEDRQVIKLCDELRIKNDNDVIIRYDDGVI